MHVCVPVESKFSLAYPRDGHNNFLVKYARNCRNRNYRPWAIPQALGSSGAQTGTGSMLVRAAVTLFWVEAEEVWVVATAPVRTRIATKARTMFFIEVAPFASFIAVNTEKERDN
jgi:hypothetical protein